MAYIRPQVRCCDNSDMRLLVYWDVVGCPFCGFFLTGLEIRQMSDPREAVDYIFDKLRRHEPSEHEGWL